MRLRTAATALIGVLVTGCASQSLATPVTPLPPPPPVATSLPGENAAPIGVMGAATLLTELRAIATSLVTTKGHLGIGASYVENDFSAIVVLVHDHVQDYDALADSLTREVGFPVEVQPGAPVPAVG